MGLTLSYWKNRGSAIRQRAEQRLRIAQEKREKQQKVLEEIEEEQNREKEIQELLKGKCSSGYEWIKQESGYRCAGGICSATFEEMRDWQVSR